MNKRKILDIIFVLVLTSISCLFLLNSSIVNGDDLNYHLYRLVGLKDAFSEGQFLPKIYPYANYGFGYASPLFYCDLFLYPFALLHLLGVSLIVSYKIMILFIALFTTIAVLYVSKHVFNGKYTPYIVSSLYILSNYRFVNLVSRAAVGELYAMLFIPLCLYAMYKILVLNDNSYLLLAFSFSGLLMSHILSTVLLVIFFLISIIVYIIRSHEQKQLIKKTLICILKGTIIAALLTAWYLLPMIEQMLDQEFWFSYNNYFPKFSNPNLSIMFHVFANMNGAQTLKVVSIGLILYIVPFIYIFEKKYFLVNYVIAISVILFLFGSGLIMIDKVMKLMQFSFRFYILLLPLLLYVIGYVIDNMDNILVKRSVVVILIVYCLVNALIVNIKAVKNSNDKYNNLAVKEDLYDNEGSKDNARNIYYNDSELSDGQYRPYEATNYLKSATKYISYINEKNEPIEVINDYIRKYTSFEFNTSFEKKQVLELPILWYKGYKAYEIVNSNNNYLYNPINCYMNDRNKKVLIDIESGEHTYYVAYEGTKIQKGSLYLSILTLCGVIIYVIFDKCRKQRYCKQ